MTDFFLRPYFIFALVLVAPICFGWARRQITLRHSSLAPHKGMLSFSGLTIIASICLALMTTNVIVAAMGPKVPDAVVEHKVEIRKVCIQVDRSGSMTSVLNDGAKELTDDEAKANLSATSTVDSGSADKLSIQTEAKPEEAPHQMTRADAAQMAARYVIRHRMSDNPDETDEFCLMTFDDDTYMMAPLSNDKKVLLLRTAHITENVSGGTNFAGPFGYSTGIGPLQKAVDYFSENKSPDSKPVVIMITDGLDSIPDERGKQLLQLFVENHIHFYVIGLGEPWKTGAAPLDLEKWANNLHALDPNNGLIFRASNPGDMEKAMETINRLEKSQEVVQERQEYREIYGWFLLAAGIFGALFIALSVVARRVP